MLLLLFSFVAAIFLFPPPSNAQIPICHQLIFAYTPIHYYNYTVLGTTTTNPSSLPLPSKNVTIALFGDSMIETLGEEIPSLKSALLKHYPLYMLNLHNFGVGSQTIVDALPRLTEEYQYRDSSHPSLVSAKPDLIIIESFAYNNLGNTSKGFQDYQDALDNTISNIRTKLPQTKILLASTIAPNSTIFANNVKGLSFSSEEKLEKTQTIKKYQEFFINYAITHNLPLANAYQPSLINGQGNPGLISSTDNIHPSPLGAQFFSKIVAQSVLDNKLLD